MTARGVGVSFCCIAAFIFSIPYIAVAITHSGVAYGRFMSSFSEICGLPMAVSGCMLVVGIVYLCTAEKKWAKLQKDDSLGKIFCILGKPTSKKREIKNEEIWIYDSDPTIKRAITFHNGFLEKIETISKEKKE